MGILEFTVDYQGRRVTAPGGNGGQCVDLANLWLIACGGSPVRANAVDWAHAALPGWHWIPNEPANAPTPGSIVVWRRDVPTRGIGPYGHIAVAVEADRWSLITLDQDWPNGAAVALVAHDYTGVAGWWARH